MQKIKIAFDVDGTLIGRATPSDPDVANLRIVELLKILASFKNTYIIVWSGGGKEYAERWVRVLGLTDHVNAVMGKIEAHSSGFKPDIAIDDIQDTALGRINLIVREK